MPKRNDHFARILDDIGGEPLEGSGFEDEAPDCGFAIPPGPEDPSLDASTREEPRNVD
jgi:hypothetical protein